MSTEIVINVTAEETRVGLLEGGQLVEFYVERKRNKSLVGNIYKGRVVKILPGMQAAFVDIGLEKSAFLYVTDIHAWVEKYTPLPEEIELVSKKARQDFTIEDLIQEGQEILVQVSKDPFGGKGARLTSYITLPGRYVVLMPATEHIGISRRILDDTERRRLKAIAKSIKPDGYGLVIRTASEGSPEEDIKRDCEFLISLWEDIQRKKDTTSTPSLLYSDLDLVMRSVRDLMGQNVRRLIIDSEEEYERIKDFVKMHFEKLLGRIELYEGVEPIFDFFGIESDISKILRKKVWLKSGGYIVIDQTEAMTVIDVNTGKFVGKEELEETVLKTNLEAAKEIAYQIRLRNIGGTIVIDFIDMERHENREMVFNAFVEAMKGDRAKNTIFPPSELGLVQMTRKRTRESLVEILCKPCPYCEGKGFVKSPQSICYEIFRKIRKLAKHGRERIIVTVHPSVAKFLFDKEHQGLEDIKSHYNVSITVKENSNLHQENYELTV